MVYLPLDYRLPKIAFMERKLLDQRGWVLSPFNFYYYQIFLIGEYNWPPEENTISSGGITSATSNFLFSDRVSFRLYRLWECNCVDRLKIRSDQV